MDKSYITRFILFFVLSFLVMQGTLWYTRKNMPPPPANSQMATAPGNDRTTTATLTPEATTTTIVVQTMPTDNSRTAPAPTVTLKTDVYEIEFSTRGAVPLRWDVIEPRFMAHAQDEKGNPIKGQLLPEPLIDPELRETSEIARPFEVILRELNSRFYNELNTGLYASEGPLVDGRAGYRFTSEPNEAGLRLVKTYLFEPKSYSSRLQIALTNGGQSNITFDGGGTGLGLTLGPGIGKPLPPENPVARFVKVDAVLRTQNGFTYKHVAEFDEEQRYDNIPIEWGGIQGLYFMGVIVPAAANPFNAARVYLDRDIEGTLANSKTVAQFPSLDLASAPVKLGPGETLEYRYDVFMGPKQSEILKAAGHDLHRVLFHDSYSWMRSLCLGLMAMLSWFHGMVGNWGLAIIMLTIAVRLLVFPLVHKGMKAQAKMMQQQAKLKPLMDKINEKFKDDPTRKQQEIMKMYREHNVNPLGMFKGCIWMMIQIPIFFALYKLLSHSIDLRGAPFLWVDDLSQADKLFTLPFYLPLIGYHFNLLPIITSLTQMATSKYMSTPPSDPQQAQMQKMMIYFMPFMLLFFTYGFPAGLMLYWLVSNMWQVLQQMWVNKHMPKPPQAGTPATAGAQA